MKQVIESIKNKAIDRAYGLQPWPGYYRLRAREMDVLCCLDRVKKTDRVLEIGCGNGFVSAILSQFAEEVVSTDLSRKDPKTHSIGISKAGEFFRKVGIENCKLVSCSGEKLPFKDSEFNLVFCAHTLEHISDRAKALLEVKRVLRDSGEAIFIVPGFMERLLYPPAYYFGILKSGLNSIFKKEKPFSSGLEKSMEQPKADSTSLWSRFRSGYPYFPFPATHGEYKNYFVELVNYRLNKWIRIIEKNNLSVTASFSLSLIPLDYLFFLKDPLKFLERYSSIDKKLGRNSVLKFFGQNACFVARKSS